MQKAVSMTKNLEEVPPNVKKIPLIKENEKVMIYYNGKEKESKNRMIEKLLKLKNPGFPAFFPSANACYCFSLIVLFLIPFSCGWYST